MATAVGPAGTETRIGSLRYELRVLTTLAGTDFKLKYAGSALGYVWSVVKPLALFTMLYLVFTRVFHVGGTSKFYAVSLLIGIVLYYFFTDAALLGMNSIVMRADLVRRLSFPRRIVTVSATLTALLTLGVNLTVIGGFITYKEIVPQPDWLLIPLLLLELYVFTLGVALILATLLVRMRDVGQIWELFAQLFMYATPIIYPIGFLPPWARHIAFLNPFTQVLQDIRAIVMYEDVPQNRITATTAFGTPWAHLIPIAIAIAIFVIGLVMMKREEKWFAERI
jgi:ABC-2 type transport system permease protein